MSKWRHLHVHRMFPCSSSCVSVPQVNDGVILYDQNKPGNVGWSAADYFSFTVSSPPAFLPPHTFTILISYQANEDHDNPKTRLLNNAGTVSLSGRQVSSTWKKQGNLFSVLLLSEFAYQARWWPRGAGWPLTGPSSTLLISWQKFQTSSGKTTRSCIGLFLNPDMDFCRYEDIIWPGTWLFYHIQYKAISAVSCQNQRKKIYKTTIRPAGDGNGLSRWHSNDLLNIHYLGL